MVYDSVVPRPSVRSRILDLFASGARLRASQVARTVGVTRQAAHRHLAELVAGGELIVEGRGRAVSYRGAATLPLVRRYPRAVIAEDRVWSELATKYAAIASLPSGARSIFAYAFTELLNNAVEHSGSDEVEVRFETIGNGLAFEIIDEGIGLFDHIRKGLKLRSNLEALQELTKGKVTTLPAAHTGEGIFFTSKVADRFEIDSGSLRWQVDNRRSDVAVGKGERKRGTRVRFEGSLRPKQTLKDVFDAYTVDYEFSKTRVVIKLFTHGERFISRSEARRVTHGLERFGEAILDFHGVTEVGQGFVDEVFRVWSASHQKTKLTPVNMTAEVRFMIERGIARRNR